LRVKLVWYEHDLDWATPVHILLGFTAGALNAVNPLAALQLVLLFLLYQLIEAISRPEKDWEDVAEFTAGWLAGLAVALLA